MAGPEPQVAPIQGDVISADVVRQHESLYKAVWDGNYDATDQEIRTNPTVVKAGITFSRRTALHVAVMAGHTSIVELLVLRMFPEDLEITDADGFTALAVAIISNATTSIAECMVRKNPRILTIKVYNMLPVAMAFRYGHKELGQYLYFYLHEFYRDYLILNPQDGASVICNAIHMQSFEVALDLLSKCKELAITVESNPDGCPRPPVHALAKLPSAFLRGCRIRFWQRWLYNSICIGSTSYGNIHMEFNNLPIHVTRERSTTPGLDTRWLTCGPCPSIMVVTIQTFEASTVLTGTFSNGYKL